MTHAELAARLSSVDGSDDERRKLLHQYAHLADARLAHLLKDACVEAWSSNPARTFHASAALNLLRTISPSSPEIRALALWSDGIVALVDGQMERAIARLDDSSAQFVSLADAHTAAATQVVKLYALAMLGRYDEAIQCGLQARDVFVAHHDVLAAGKIEHNIGNIYKRRDRYDEAERFQLSARTRFAALNDEKQLAKIDNCLANIHTLQHKFRSAEELYRQAFERAEATGLAVTQAEIEASMGNLALFQGRYERALDYLERSRRRYARIGMPHKSAIAEQEIADAYLELNLIPEANAIYERVIPTFVQLGMRAEEALARANQGRALIQLGRYDKAHHLLTIARQLYVVEENAVGSAMVTLTEAQLNYAEGDYLAAQKDALRAEIPLAAAGNWRRLLIARWLRGEATRALGEISAARPIFTETLRDAQEQSQPQIEYLCQTSLGLLNVHEGRTAEAEQAFNRAISIIETLRAPLPAEEFRTAFFADKLVPYKELIKLYLNNPQQPRVSEAFQLTERARSRALSDVLGGGRPKTVKPRDAYEETRLTRLDELRDELNWFYAKVNRANTSKLLLTPEETAAFHEAIREREGAVMEIMRQLHHRGTSDDGLHGEVFQPESLSEMLGEETALVAYTALDKELIAFVVCGNEIKVFRQLATVDEMASLVNQLRFQIDALRYGSGRVRKHVPQLTGRVNKYLHTLDHQLIEPLRQHIENRRLVIVPHGELHYLPFHALYDGEQYLIERQEVSYAPSASVLSHCLRRPQRGWSDALLLGIADEEIPHVRQEINSLARLFPQAKVLLDEQATLSALQQNSATADVLHLACHGQFRPDNPLFSSLRLADGWLTVADANKLDLQCNLLTLSACETGVNAVAPGDELLGLARGFLTAGAPSLLLSLWNVDDESTATLMGDFYWRVQQGERPGAALRQAQIKSLRTHGHPFFWSPFVLFGRW